MSEAFNEEQDWIMRRVRENRERYADEPQIDDAEDEQFIGARLVTENGDEGSADAGAADSTEAD